MKEYIKTIPLTTIILLYLFFCGGLYLIGYWETFDLKMQEWVSIWEIPKSSIYPLAISIAVFLSVKLTFYTIKKAYKITVETNRTKRKSGFLTILHAFSFILIIALYNSFKYSFIYWIISIFWMFLPLSVIIIDYLTRYEIVQQNREFFKATFSLIMITPFITFLLGKANGIEVYNNSKINIVNKKIIANISDTSQISSIKFLGSLGDKFIVSDLSNKKIFVINQSDGMGIEIQIPNESRNKFKLY